MIQSIEFEFRGIRYAINLLKCDHHGDGEFSTCMKIYGPVRLASSLPLLHKMVEKNRIIWFPGDEDWIPKEVQEYCNRLAKNKAFL